MSSMLPMMVTIGIVIAGVLVARPGIGMLLAAVFAIALIAIRKERRGGTQAKSDGTPAKAHKDAARPSVASLLTLVLKILAVAFSAIIAIVISTLCVLIFSIISLISAIAAFFESCAELLPKQ